MGDAVLAYTVHHKGRKYLAGASAAQVGPAAAEIGDHAWVGGKGPGKAEVDPGAAPGGSLTGTPPDAKSALGTPAAVAEPEPEPVDAGDGEAPASARASRRGNR